MVWFCLLSLLTCSSLLICWYICKSHLACQQSREASEGIQLSGNSILLSQTASECCSLLASLEDHKTQLRNRLLMLDEMIEKSDREIESLFEQLSRINQFRNQPLDPTGRDMITLLRAGGYDENEIRHLTLRDNDELEDAA